MRPLPRAPGFDQTLGFARDPYRYISRTCQALGSDVFHARLLLQPTICLRGAEAAALFYGSPLIIRHGAMPQRIQRTLTGRQAIQGLDDEAHHHRKALFLAILSPARVADLAERVGHDWKRWTRERLGSGPRRFYDEAKELLLRAVCDWAGVPLDEMEVARRTREIAALYEHAAAIGPRHWWARWARRRTERWSMGIIDDVRRGALRPDPASAAARIAFHQGPDGAPLPPRIAAVELLNILRPTVAVAVYLTQAVHALHLHPGERDRIAAAPTDPWRVHRFVQEVRRWYPFFPAAMARMAEDLVWRDHRLPRGWRVLLDLYGTNRDANTWADPEDFRPARFATHDDDGRSLIPQGGGDAAVSHRCPGEPLTIALLQATVAHFACDGTWRVPEQDLRLDYRHPPALPSSRLWLHAAAG